MSKTNFYQTYKYQEYGFNTFIIISYTIYILTALGIASISPKYIDTLDFWVKIYISLFLLIRFNGFVGKIKFTELDRKIVFSSGLFLLTTIGVNQLLQNYIEQKVKKIPIHVPVHLNVN